MVRSAPRPVPHRRLARNRTAVKHPLNRRRTNWPRRILLVALLILALECVAVALLSPRLYVRQLSIQGLETLSTSLVEEQLPISATQNLLLAPTQAWVRQVERIPGVASAQVQRALPGTIRLIVQERKPWATVRTSDGRWHTVDTSFIPFRIGKKPEANLLQILAFDLAPWEAIPGMPLPSSGLLAAQECERWIKAHPDFRISSIKIDQESKVCLNREGGVPVQLGMEEGLSQKLRALERLILERPDITYRTDIAYINLYAADAPAIGPISTKKPKQ